MDKKENNIMDKISDNEDEISDDEIDGVLDELKNNENIKSEICCKENIKEELNKSKEEIVVTTKNI